MLNKIIRYLRYQPVIWRYTFKIWKHDRKIVQPVLIWNGHKWVRNPAND